MGGSRPLLLPAASGGKLGRLHGAVIVTMAVVRMVEVAVYQVVDVRAVGHRFVAAVQAVAVIPRMSPAGVVRCAGHRVAFIDG